MDESEMVERVADALVETREQSKYLQARAAIAAMREPTQTMLAAGMVHEAIDLASEYRAMINAALAPTIAQSLPSYLDVHGILRDHPIRPRVQARPSKPRPR